MKRILCCLSSWVVVLTAQPTPCAMRGMVVDALTKQPLPHTRVFAEISSDEDSNSPPLRQLTDANGKFCFEKLTAGEYQIWASRAYYIDAHYGQRWPGTPGPLIKVPLNKQESFLAINMVPQAVISGVLVDAEGDPLQDAQVKLLKGRWRKQRLISDSIQETITDDKGRYRFAGLAAGTYFLSATPIRERQGLPFLSQPLDQSRQPFRQLESRTYYQDALSLHEATPIHVSAGQEIRDLPLTFRMAEARHVRGQVASEVPDISQRVLYFNEADSITPTTWHNVSVQGDGHFIADGLLPNRYLIQGTAVVSKIIDLTAGDIDDLVLEGNQPIEIVITVHLPDPRTHPVRNLILSQRATEGDEEVRSIKAQPVKENKFKFAVRPGQYEITPEDDGSAYFMKDLVINGEPQARNILELQQGAPKSIDLFLSSDLASVEGRIISDQPIKDGVTLLLESESDPDLSSTKLSGSNGKFYWALSQAGKYRLYAFQEFAREAWETPGVASLLAIKSVILDVKEGQHVHVDVPLIYIEDLQNALAKANL